MGAKTSKANSKQNNYYTITESNNNHGFISDEDSGENMFRIAEKKRQVEMKILQQLRDEGISLTNHRTGGVAFFVPINEKKSCLGKPPRPSKRQGGLCSFSSEERQIIADIMHQNNLRQRGEKARTQADKLLKASKRREFMEQQRKAKLEIRMKKIAEGRIMREENLRQIKINAQNNFRHTGSGDNT